MQLRSTSGARHRASSRPLALRSRLGRLGAAATLAAGIVVAPSALPDTEPEATAAVPTAASTGTTSRLQQVVAAAKRGIAMKVPYRYGGGHGATPSISGGADCSGFVRWAYYVGFGGLDIGSGGSESIRRSGKFVRTNNPVPGDIALFGRGGTGPAYHSGIYIGKINGHPAIAAEVTTGTTAHVQQWYNSSWPRDLIGYYRLRSATAADTSTRIATTAGIRLGDGSAEVGQRIGVVASVHTTAGAGVTGVPLKLYQRTAGGQWRLGGTATSNARGYARFTLTANSYGHDYKVVTGATAKYASSTSRTVRQTVSFDLDVSSSPAGTARANSVGAIRGRTSPALAGHLVRVQKITRNGWVAAGGASIVGSDGRFTIHWRLDDASGTYYRLTVPGTSYTGASVSDVLPVVLT